jgi:hypothetical protein
MGLPSLPILLIIAAALSVCIKLCLGLFHASCIAATELVKSVLGTFDNPTCVFVTLCGKCLQRDLTLVPFVETNSAAAS